MSLCLGAVARDTGKGVTASSAAWCLCKWPDTASWAYEQERYTVCNAIASAKIVISSPPLAATSAAPTSKKDRRPSDNETPDPANGNRKPFYIPKTLSDLRVSTDYQFGCESLIRAGIHCTLEAPALLETGEAFNNNNNNNNNNNSTSTGNGDGSNSSNSSLGVASNFLFRTGHIKNFYSIPPDVRVCQFPYEGGLVRKDLLLLTVRAYCYSSDKVAPFWWNPCYDLSTEFHIFLKDVILRFGSSSSSSSPTSGALSINSSNNNWIFKPAQGHRGLGHKIINSDRHMSSSSSKSTRFSDISESAADKSVDDTAVVKDLLESLKLVDDDVSSSCSSQSALAGIFRDIVESYRPFALPSLESNGNSINTKRNGTSPTSSAPIPASAPTPAPFADVVAQLLIMKPLTLRNRKFDVRVFVFVRSFVPFEAYFSTFYYARLANKDYNPVDINDPEVVLTVSAYNEDDSIANRQERLTSAELKAAIESEYPHIDYEGMIAKMRLMLKEIFGGAAASIGLWPRSSAYYGVDVIFDCEESNDLSVRSDLGELRNPAGSMHSIRTSTMRVVPTPKLLEINYMGDLKGVQKISTQMQRNDVEKDFASVFTSSVRVGEKSSDSTAASTPTAAVRKDEEPVVGSSSSSLSTSDNSASSSNSSSSSSSSSSSDSSSNSGEFNEIYIEFIRDMMGAIGTSDAVNPKRCVRL